MGMELYTSKLRQVWRNKVGVLPLTAYVKYLREEFGAEPGGGNWDRGEGNLHCFLPQMKKP